MVIRNKKAAMELSMSTIVILVLAMSMLILGLVLVRGIFRSATTTVDELDDKVKAEITNLFVDEGKKIVVKLGADRTAKIKADGETVNIAFGAKTIDGSGVDIKSLKYKLSLDDSARENCYSILKRKKVEEFIGQRTDTWLQFDRFEGDTAYALVEIQIPEGTTLCSQKVFIDVKDGQEQVGRELFKIEILRKGFF